MIETPILREIQTSGMIAPQTPQTPILREIRTRGMLAPQTPQFQLQIVK